ncbi:PilZ domain-containing protein [Paludibaculum fermentans]|uniref:PilZ domain-containing protein n=1 Tax=Paludibaculum fermentans TaxID=1473598 RepID=A0A7S7NTC8_PALFE|nr:PilZ domain-containing protein [Paludibaculum fermentans]QOY89385.1 PilZ domain-containing protein [Paludibaculum fermentans]
MESQQQTKPVIGGSTGQESETSQSLHRPGNPISFAIRRAALGGKDARTEPRFAVREEKAVLWVLHPRQAHAREGRLLDVSHSGLGIVLPEEIPAGSWIRVEFGDVAVFGEVRYCRQQAGGEFRMGALTDWVIAKADIARWGALRGPESEAQLCDAFRQMKRAAVRYGPPI